MSSFRDLKNASGRDSKIVRDFALSDICVYLGLSQTSYCALTSFGKGNSLTFHLLAQALTVERTVIGCGVVYSMPGGSVLFFTNSNIFTLNKSSFQEFSEIKN